MSTVEVLEKENIELKEIIKNLQQEYDTTRGLWCVDKNPKDVDIEWIRLNCFPLELISNINRKSTHTIEMKGAKEYLDKTFKLVDQFCTQFQK
jgi:hypothetical protein